jgi:hypothetical protein
MHHSTHEGRLTAVARPSIGTRPLAEWFAQGLPWIKVLVFFAVARMPLTEELRDVRRVYDATRHCQVERVLLVNLWGLHRRGFWG